MTEPESIDVLVVGGGPAGLTAALWLGRHRFRTVLVDRGEHRNRWADASFGYLGFDGQPPEAIIKAGRAELERYPDVRIVEGGVRAVHREGDGFCAELDDQTLRCTSVVFASGVSDVVPPLPGLREHYGTTVFVCPLCDGYEFRDKHIVVLGAGGTAGAFAGELLNWASSITVVALGAETPKDALPDTVLIANGAAANVVGIDALEGIELADGSVVACDAVFFRSETIAATDMAAHLGCDLDDDGLVIVDEDGVTSVENVYAAGDCTPGPRLVQVAAAQGARVGLRCAQSLMARRAS